MRDLLDKDRQLFVLLHGRLRRSWVDPIMIGFTRAGTKGAVWLVVAACLLVASGTRGRWIALLSLAALLAAEGLINLILKPLARRSRPYTHHGLAALLVPAPGPHSWPSAHAGSSMAAAVVLATVSPWWGLLFLATALVIGYSRVYVGVHYPLDVLAGMALGVTCALAVLAGGALLAPILHMSMAAAFVRPA
jgi:undecaprenyl-diphosphatase